MSLWGSLLLVLIFSGEVKGRVGTHVLGFVLDLETEDEDRMEAEYKVFSSPSFFSVLFTFFLSLFSFSFASVLPFSPLSAKYHKYYR